MMKPASTQLRVDCRNEGEGKKMLHYCLVHRTSHVTAERAKTTPNNIPTTKTRNQWIRCRFGALTSSRSFFFNSHRSTVSWQEKAANRWGQSVSSTLSGRRLALFFLVVFVFGDGGAFTMFFFRLRTDRWTGLRVRWIGSHLWRRPIAFFPWLTRCERALMMIAQGWLRREGKREKKTLKTRIMFADADPLTQFRWVFLPKKD